MVDILLEKNLSIQPKLTFPLTKIFIIKLTISTENPKTVWTINPFTLLPIIAIKFKNGIRKDNNDRKIERQYTYREKCIPVVRHLGRH